MAQDHWEWDSGFALQPQGRPSPSAREIPQKLPRWSGRPWPLGKTANSKLTGVANHEAAKADIVVIATPWEAVVQTVLPFADDLAGGLVISVGNALVKEGREFQAISPLAVRWPPFSRPPCLGRVWSRRATTSPPVS